MDEKNNKNISNEENYVDNMVLDDDDEEQQIASVKNKTNMSVGFSKKKDKDDTNKYAAESTPNKVAQNNNTNFFKAGLNSGEIFNKPDEEEAIKSASEKVVATAAPAKKAPAKKDSAGEDSDYDSDEDEDEKPDKSSSSSDDYEDEKPDESSSSSDDYEDEKPDTSSSSSSSDDYEDDDEEPAEKSKRKDSSDEKEAQKPAAAPVDVDEQPFPTIKKESKAKQNDKKTDDNNNSTMDIDDGESDGNGVCKKNKKISSDKQVAKRKDKDDTDDDEEPAKKRKSQDSSTEENCLKTTKYSPTTYEKSFLDMLDDELQVTKLSENVRKVLTKHGFDNAFAFVHLNDETLKEIENHETEERKEKFTFFGGVKITLKELAKIVDKKGLIYWKNSTTEQSTNSHNVSKNEAGPYSTSNIVKVLASKIYIDKTKYIYQLIKKYERIFIVRPRRFGKSLCIDTIESIFRGKMEIFKKYNCYISKVNWSEIYPVLRFDFSRLQTGSVENFQTSLIRQMERNAKSCQIKIKVDESNPIDAFEQLMMELRNPVVLIDEYDAPINSLHENSKEQAYITNHIQHFFTILKSYHCRFVFVTGICKFSMAGIGSGSNDMKDLSLSEDACQLFGFSDKEIKKTFRKTLKKMCTETHPTVENVIENMKVYYNGYRFSTATECVLNPTAVISCIQEGKIGDYWCHTTAATLVKKVIMKYSTQFCQLIESPSFECKESELMNNCSPLETMELIPLLYQTGYLSIKSYNKTNTDTNFKLDYPNVEIKNYVEKYLKDYALDLKTVQYFTNHSEIIIEALLKEDIKPFIKYLKSALATRSCYQKLGKHLDKTAVSEEEIRKKCESEVHSLCLMLFIGLQWSGKGLHVSNESFNSIGRSDIQLYFEEEIKYILELKYVKKRPSKETLVTQANYAIDQIKESGYWEPHTTNFKKIFFVAIIFVENADIGEVSFEQWDGTYYRDKDENEKEIKNTDK